MTSPDLPETADPDLCRRVRLLGDILSVSATAQASNARQSTLKEWAYSADKRPIHRLQFDRMVVLFSMLEGKRDVAWAITTFAMDALESVARPKPDGREFSDSDAPRRERGQGKRSVG